MIEGNALVVFGKAMLMIAANRPPTDANYVELCPTALGMIANGSDEIRSGRFKRATATFSVTLDLVRSARPEQRGHLMALVMLNQCRLLQAQKRWVRSRRSFARRHWRCWMGSRPRWSRRGFII